MADSDEEYDRRNVRDKFRHERSDYERKEDRRSRENWQDKSSSTSSRSRDRREGYRDSDRSRRDKQSSPAKRDGSPPPVKRVRRDGDDGSYRSFRVPYGGGPGHTGGGPQPGSWAPGAGDVPPPQGFGGVSQGSGETEFLTQPPMMTMKQFIASQDENITDAEAHKRYTEYRAEFRRQQINEFFVQHKDEEWFRTKYHPDEYQQRQDDARKVLKHRCSVFMKLLKLGRLSKVSVDIDQTKELVRILDAAVVLMEGGSEFDLKAIDEDEIPGEESSQNRTESESQNNKREKDTDALSDKSADSEDEATHPKFTEPLRLGAESKPTVPEANKLPSTAQAKSAERSKKKRRRMKSDASAEDGSMTSSSSDSDEGSVHSDKNDEPVPPGTEGTQQSDAVVTDEDGTAKDEDKKDSSTAEAGEISEEPKPQALHKTLSIFLRNLMPAITQQEVEAVCKQYPGFLRVALQDPQPERRFARRGWVTFDRNVNVKEICYNLNQIRLRDCDMGAIVNRDLQQRIRPVNGLTIQQQVAKSDVKNAAKIIQNFDDRWGLWDEAAEGTGNADKPNFGFVSNNPILKNITDYLVDEGSYEEELLMGEDIDSKKDSNAEVTFDRDKDLMKVLDRMILYLRVVYSFDYYSTVEYPHEDAMPHRCGIMHARGPVPRGKVTQHDINDWLASFEVRIGPFVNLKIKLNDAEVAKLGKKNDEEELEKFITANTQELAKDKWLCPLSGKKFKGPEFVRKHILAKHVEKIEELKKDVVYFNTYLEDPRRPQLPEHPTTRMMSGPPPPREGYIPPAPGFHGPPPAVMGYRPPMIYQGRRGGPVPYNPLPFHSRGHDHFRGGDYRPRDNPRFAARRDRSKPDPRPVISYTDLDAPAEVD